MEELMKRKLFYDMLKTMMTGSSLAESNIMTDDVEARSQELNPAAIRVIDMTGIEDNEEHSMFDGDLDIELNSTP
eukprot:UN09108